MATVSWIPPKATPHSVVVVTPIYRESARPSPPASSNLRPRVLRLDFMSSPGARRLAFPYSSMYLFSIILPCLMVTRGIADSHLNCLNSSMASFPTWAQAHGYYSACFAANSVHIRQPRDEKTPIHSPTRKKMKVWLTRAEAARRARAAAQPHLAPAVNRYGSPPLDCVPMSANHENRPDHGALVATHDPVADLARSINCSYHQVRADAIARAKSVNKGPHHGAQATATQSQPQDPVSSPPISRPIVVVVDSSDDDEMTTTNSEHKCHIPNNRNVPALPVASSSLIVEVNSDPPANHLAESPTIIVYDSEEEELTFPGSDNERMLNYLQGGIQKPGPTPRGHRRL